MWPFRKYVEKFMEYDDFVPTIKYSEELLTKRLNDGQFMVTQRRANEYPHTGRYLYTFEEGKYNCVVCDVKLFDSKDKYHIVEGPHNGYMGFEKKTSNVVVLGIQAATRVIPQLTCTNCGSYIGEMYRDGPKGNETKKYMVNSGAVVFLAKSVEGDLDKAFNANK